MSSAQRNGVPHSNDTPHFYSNSRNLITIALWCLALGTHVILIPKLARELYQDARKRRS
jgi:hypothetical protein